MRSNRNLSAVLLTSTMLASLSTLGLVSAAQAAPQAAQAPEAEVIVTAQKRSERLQNVPISIQVLGTKKLDQLNITNFNQYAAMLPSVSFQTTQPGTTNVYMRGVASGGDGNHSGSLPSVGIYLDEQPVTTIGGALDVHIYDIERIESLAGPQGTLYGASSEAGTIRIISNKPDMSGFYGRFDADVNSVAHGGTGHKVEGMLNVPISPKAAMRFVGWVQHDAGYIDNVAGTRSFLPTPGGITVNNSAFVKNDYNDVDIVGGRAALKIDLDDNWTATATLLAQDQKNHGTFGYDATVGDLKVQHFFPDSFHDRFTQAALTIQGKLGNFDLTYAGAYMDRTTDGQADYSDYAEAYDDLYSYYGGVAGYFYITNSLGVHIDPRQKIVGHDEFTKTSHELRLASPQDQSFRYIVGLFSQEQTHFIHQDYQIPHLSAAMSVNGKPGTLWLTQQDRVDKDFAIFGEASLDLTPKLTMTLGGRSFNYDNTLIGFFGFGRDLAGPPYNGAGSSRTGVAGCYTTTGQILRDNLSGTLLPAAVAGSPCTNLGVFNAGKITPKRAKGSGFSPKVNLTWKPNTNLMIYATWSKGFRPGGINRRSTVLPYEPDYLTNLELGFRKTLLDGKMKFNATVYRQNWEAFQYSYLGLNSFTEVHNGPDAVINGLEMDVSYRVDSHLSMTFNAAYNDAKTVNDLCGIDDGTAHCTGLGNFVVSPSGTKLPVTPELNYSGSVRYSWDMGNTKPYMQAVVSHKSSSPSDLRRFAIQPGTGAIVDPAALTGPVATSTVVDFAIGTQWSTWTMELYVRNLFDERNQISRFQECGQCYQRPYIVTGTPRTLSLRLGSKF